MSLKNKLIALALGLAALAPAAANAEHNRWGNDRDRKHDRDDRNRRDHSHDQGCHHEATPAVDPQAGGRYELRTVQTWVQASYEEVWVPRTCTVRPFRHRVVCTGGFYEQQLQPGHFENVQEYVWVPDYRPYQYGSVTPPRPVQGTWTSSASAGPVSFQASGAF
ncbi:MAG: hypothetical protein ACYC8T_13200 [Myxococcaceae bacterium]